MYVCVCFAVTKSELETAIVGGARTTAEVTAKCRAGGDCGACLRLIDREIQRFLQLTERVITRAD